MMNEIDEETYVQESPPASVRSLTNASQREEYVPEPDTNYRTGSMDYKLIPSKGIA